MVCRSRLQKSAGQIRAWEKGSPSQLPVLGKTLGPSWSLSWWFKNPQRKAGHRTVSGSWALTQTQIQISKSLQSPLPHCYPFPIKTLRVHKEQTKIWAQLRFTQELWGPSLPPPPSLPIICICDVQTSGQKPIAGNPFPTPSRTYTPNINSSKKNFTPTHFDSSPQLVQNFGMLAAAHGTDFISYKRFVTPSLKNTSPRNSHELTSIPHSERGGGKIQKKHKRNHPCSIQKLICGSHLFFSPLNPTSDFLIC